METKKISEWERELGMMLLGLGGRSEDDTISKDEFMEGFPDKHRGVAYDDRVDFLKRNGYALTRDNLMNPDLSASVEGK